MSDENAVALTESPAPRASLSAMPMTRRAAGGGVVLLPNNFNEVIIVADMMSRAQHAVPKHLRGNAGACMAVVLRASGWEMDPFAVATKTYFVNDNLAFEAQLVAAVVNTRAPVKGRPKLLYEGDGVEMRLTITYEMIDGDFLPYTSPRIKDIKVKNSPLWVGDPGQQLFYFASRAWARRWVPEVLLGVYTPDEMIEQVGEEQGRARSFADLEARALGPAQSAAQAASASTLEGGAADVIDGEFSEGPIASPQPAPPAETPVPADAAAEPASPAGTVTVPGTEATSAGIGRPASEEPKDPAADAYGTEEEIAAAGGMLEPPAHPKAFTDFLSAVAAAKTWDPIQPARLLLTRSPEWSAATIDVRERLHAIAYMRLVELNEGGYRFDFITNLHAYRCYIDWEVDLAALEGNRRIVHNTEGWKLLDTRSKIAFDGAYDTRVARIKGGLVVKGLLS